MSLQMQRLVLARLCVSYDCIINNCNISFCFFVIIGFLLPVLQQLLYRSRIGLNISSPFAAILVPTPDLAHQVSNAF